MTSKLQQEKNTAQRSNLTQKQKQLLLNKFLEELKMSEGIKSPHTLVKHLQKTRQIIEANEDVDWTSRQGYSKTFAKDIRKQISQSQYKKRTDKYSEYSKRNKEDFWLSFKYWTKHVMNRQEDLPDAEFTERKENVDKQAETRPEDLPNADQMRKLLRTFPQVSDTKTAKRNQAFFALIWSIGTRSGETLPIQMKDIDVTQDKLRIYIHGNKRSGDDWVRVMQCEQLLREYIQQHPAKNNSEAYLFPKSYHNQWHTQVRGSELAKKMRQAQTAANLDFKTYGEPIHIFRKAMSTYNVVNDILSWEGVCKKQRKSADGTKPDYLLQAMDDIEAKEAENLGLQEETQSNGHMIGQPLMPQECLDCGRRNTCIAENCKECGGELEQNQMPKNKDVKDESEIRREELKQTYKTLTRIAENADVELDDL